jgi:hypothetical protein
MADTSRIGSDTLAQQLDSLRRLRAGAFATSLLGLEALRQGNRAAAVGQLSDASERLRSTDTWVTVIDFVLGKEYLAAGDLDRAYRHMMTPQRWASGAEADLIVPREFYLGQIAEARGNRGAAREHYARFVRWWRDCDPELRPWWEEGRDALERVSGERIVQEGSGP